MTEPPKTVRASYQGTWRRTVHDFVFSFKGMFGIIVIAVFVILPYLAISDSIPPVEIRRGYPRSGSDRSPFDGHHEHRTGCFQPMAGGWHCVSRSWSPDRLVHDYPGDTHWDTGRILSSLFRSGSDFVNGCVSCDSGSAVDYPSRSLSWPQPVQSNSNPDTTVVAVCRANSGISGSEFKGAGLR